MWENEQKLKDTRDLVSHVHEHILLDIICIAFLEVIFLPSHPYLCLVLLVLVSVQVFYFPDGWPLDLFVNITMFEYYFIISLYLSYRSYVFVKTLVN